MAEAIAPSITIEKYIGTEKPFDPAAVTLQFELKKIEDNLLPEDVDLKETPAARPYQKRAALLDIETTGLYPWESRLICVGILDLQYPEEAPTVFVNEDEETMIKNFAAWFEAQEFEEVWAYNGIFDARFLFGVCMRYRVQAPTLFNVVWHDLMSWLKKAKEAYMEGTQKAGTLDQWGAYVLGREKTLTFEKMMEFWEKRDLEAIVRYNVNDLEMEYELWLLIMFVTGQYDSLPEVLIPIGSEAITGETKLVTCPECGQVNEVPKEATEYKCVGCDDTISI